MKTDKPLVNRLHELDALRGVSLLGILLVNIFVFHAPYLYFSEFYGEFDGIQGKAVAAVVNFASGKFLFIFAFLFGYGIAIQKQKYGISFNAHHIKRMAVLLVFGLVHILFFWFGDILTSYALLGFLLISFIRLPNKYILLMGFSFLIVRPIYYFGAVSFNWSTLEMIEYAELNEFLFTFQEGSYGEIFLLRMKEFLAFIPESLIWFIPKTLGLFLIGFYCFQRNFMVRIQQNSKRYLLVCIILLISSIAWIWLKLDFFAKFDLEATPMMRPILICINVVFETAQGMGYVIGFILLFQNSRKVTNLFTATGRLALTNYFMQSLICVTIFFGYGLGFYGKLLPTDLILISLAIFGLNSWFSKIYLKYHQYGPLEYLWRKLINNKI